MIQNGLKPTKRLSKKWYPTDRSFHRTFGGVKPFEFFKNFSVDSGLTMPDQNAIGLYLGCTGVTQSELCTDQDGIVYDDYEYVYRKTLEMEGVFELNKQGCDIRDSLKIICTLGPKTKLQGDVDGEAKARGAYYAVESDKFDWFDSFRSVIQTNWVVNQRKCAISIGTPWFKEWDIMSVKDDGIVPQIFTGDPMSLSWHNWAIKGWKEINGIPYLIAKTWQGKSYGDGGWSYYDRETINKVMKIKYTAAYTVAPRDASNVGFVKRNLIETILAFADQLLQRLFKKKQSNVNIPTSETTPVAEIPKPETLKYDWSTQEKARYSVRMICDEEGLSVKDKNDLCATVGAESGWKPRQRSLKANFDGTYDHGIIQLNEKYWIGEGKLYPNIEAVYNDPEGCIRWMCRNWKRNKNWWYAYKNGSYLRYMNPKFNNEGKLI